MITGTEHGKMANQLESDTYDVVVLGTGLAESIAAAYVAITRH